MIQGIIHKYFFYLFVFILFFRVLLYNMIDLKGMDAVSDIVLLATYFLFLFSTKERKMNWGIIITLTVFLFYLAYSFLIVLKSTRSAITLDFMMQIRPYLTFFIVSQMVCAFTDSHKRLLKQLCFSMWVLFIPLGIYGLISPVAFAGLVSRPSNYVSSVVFLSLLYLYCCGFSVKERLTFLLMLSMGLIIIHARFYGFFILTGLILAYFYRPDVLLSKLRTGVAVVLVLGATVYISESQITDYLSPKTIAENDYSYTARSSQYQTAAAILKDFFPLGSGFASFATYASDMRYSKIYADAGLSPVKNPPTAHEWLPASDSYYPSLAQFGIVGIVLYLTFWAYIGWLIFAKLRKRQEIQPLVVALILTSFVFIENIFDSFFTSNNGVFMMMFLGILFSKPNTDSIRRRKNNRPAATQSTVKIAMPLSVAPLTAQESKQFEPDTASTGNKTEDEPDDEYDDFEEYCEDENATHAYRHTPPVPPVRNTALPDEHPFDEEEPADEEEDFWTEDTHPATDQTPATPDDTPQPEPQTPIATPQDETDATTMEKDFLEVVKRIKAHADERRRLIREEETADDDFDDDDDGYDRLDYSI